MNYIALANVDRKAEIETDIIDIMDEYFLIFKDAIGTINKRGKIDEIKLIKQIILNKSVQKNKYQNYKNFIATLIARYTCIADDYSDVIYFIKRNIHEENIETYYNLVSNNEIKLSSIREYAEEFYSTMKYDARREKLVNSIYNGEKVLSEDKNVYVGSCKTNDKQITNEAISYRLKPNKLVEHIKNKIEKKDIMNINKLVYRYIELSGDFDTELLYIVFKFYLKNKMSRPVLEILELYCNKFKMRANLDLNLLVYIASYCNSSKKKTKQKLYIKTLEINARKRPNDISMGLLYIYNLIKIFPNEAMENMYRYLKTIKDKKLADIFIKEIVACAPKEWNVTEKSLIEVYDIAWSNRNYMIKQTSRFIRSLTTISEEEVVPLIIRYQSNCRIDIKKLVLNSVIKLKNNKETSILINLLRLLEHLINNNLYKSERYFYEALYNEIKYFFGDNLALNRINVLSKFEVNAITTKGKIEFYKHLESKDYESCYKDLFNIVDTVILQKCAYILKETSNINLDEIFNYLVRKTIQRGIIDRAPDFIKDNINESYEEFIKVKEKIKRKVVERKNKLIFSQLKYEFKFTDIEESTRKHLEKHTKIDVTKPKHSVFLGEPLKVIEEAFLNEANHEYTLNGKIFVITVPYENAGYGFGYKDTFEYYNKIKIVFEFFNNRLLSAYPY